MASVLNVQARPLHACVSAQTVPFRKHAAHHANNPDNYLATTVPTAAPGPLTRETAHDTILLELNHRTACLAARLLLGIYLCGNYPPVRRVLQPSPVRLGLKMPCSKSIIDTTGVDWRQQEGTDP